MHRPRARLGVEFDRDDAHSAHRERDSDITGTGVAIDDRRRRVRHHGFNDKRFELRRDLGIDLRERRAGFALVAPVAEQPARAILRNPPERRESSRTAMASSAELQSRPPSIWLRRG